MIPDPLLFTFALLDTGVLLFLLVYFVSFFSWIAQSSNRPPKIKYIHSIFAHFLNSNYLKTNNPTGDHFIGRWMRLLECTTMLFKVKFLGYTEIDGAWIFGHRNCGHRPLLVIFVQFTNGRLVGVWIVQFAVGQYGRLWSNRNTQSRNDQKAFEGLYDLPGLLFDILFYIFILVRLPPKIYLHSQFPLSARNHRFFLSLSVW